MSNRPLKFLCSRRHVDYTSLDGENQLEIGAKDLRSFFATDATPTTLFLAERSQLNCLEENLQRDGIFNSNESGWLPNGVVGLRANIPIYDGGDTRAKIERKKIVLEKREIELAEFNRALILQVFNARTELINAKTNLESAKRTLNLSQKIFDTTQIKYTNGVGSSLELTQAESGLYDAQANHTNAMYDILVAQSALDIATGEINKK